jgi:hypothetical protein
MRGSETIPWLRLKLVEDPRAGQQHAHQQRSLDIDRKGLDHRHRLGAQSRVVLALVPEEDADQLALLPGARFRVGLGGRFGRCGQLNVLELIGVSLLEPLEHLGGIHVELVGQQVLLLHEGLHLLLRPGRGSARLLEFGQLGVDAIFRLLLVVAGQGAGERPLNELDHVAADAQPDDEPDQQPRERSEQTAAQLFEVLPEGHRAFTKQIVFALVRHDGLPANTSVYHRERPPATKHP